MITHCRAMVGASWQSWAFGLVVVVVACGLAVGFAELDIRRLRRGGRELPTVAVVGGMIVLAAVLVGVASVVARWLGLPA